MLSGDDDVYHTMAEEDHLRSKAQFEAFDKALSLKFEQLKNMSWEDMLEKGAKQGTIL